MSDITGDTGWVNVGTDRDTAAFAVEPVGDGIQDLLHDDAGPGYTRFRPPALTAARRGR